MADYDRYGRGDRYSSNNSNNQDRYGSDRYGAQRGSGDRDYRGRDDDRGFLERGVDEVRSWFGDDEADRRRHRDADGYHYDAPGREHGGRSYEPDNRTAGFQGTWGSADARYDSRYDNGRGGGAGGGFSSRGASFGERTYGRSASGGFDRDRQQHDRSHHHDDDYRSWRDRQVAQYDRDYEEYRRERQDRFHNDFESWRNNRNTQAGAAATGVQWRTKIRDHQEVLGSDGEHVGTVDHVRGDQIQLTKREGDGEHHYLPLTSIVSVDNAVRLNVTAEEAMRQWRGESSSF